MRLSPPYRLFTAALLFVLAPHAPAQEGSTLSGRDAEKVLNRDTLLYRTFLPDSLTTRRATPRRYVTSVWEATFINRTGEIVTDLTIEFDDVSALTSFPPFPDAAPFDGGRTWVVSGQSLAPGDSVRIRGTGPARGTVIRGWHFGSFPANAGFTPAPQRFLFPMPTAANIRKEVLALGGFAPGTSESDPLGGMLVGNSFLRYVGFRWRVNTDSARVHGWVRIRRQADLYRSLYHSRYGITHAGIPRGFLAFDDGRPFLRQRYSLPPTRHNNRLFAGLVSLKLGIAASQLGVTTPGLGELVYVDAGHRLNDRMIRDISAYADSLLTYPRGTPLSAYLMVDTVIQKINAAFSGPIDTTAYGDYLVLKGVRSVYEIPFLRPNLETPPLRIPRLSPGEWVEDDEDLEEEERNGLPEVIQSAQNYPNPFNPLTTIQFELREPADVTVKVFDLLGREVQTLTEREPMFEGINELYFDGAGLASGIYLYRVSAEATEPAGRTSMFTGKMVLTK